MSPRIEDYSSYRSMWLIAMFDLPMLTKTEKKRYTDFRKLLLREGFTRLQLSVYARHFYTEDAADKIRRRISAQVPSDGQVRLLVVTDRQFGKMDVFYGKKRENAERKPKQYLLF